MTLRSRCILGDDDDDEISKRCAINISSYNNGFLIGNALTANETVDHEGRTLTHHTSGLGMDKDDWVGGSDGVESREAVEREEPPLFHNNSCWQVKCLAEKRGQCTFKSGKHRGSWGRFAAIN
jgi:hypothetical protein